ncbi:hypothetical protein [Streptomyces dysideae]|uniref:Uncharacterized protein n=1 Tax=Streptomyces dysideae TaxID=909626 RepID=A0A101V185_9ACTN|nr:hypothetical protein [Streptomyces dysideae]KUO20568.1 hypothetical protein AQJ91_13470 [Streptomyces dysideae]
MTAVLSTTSAPAGTGRTMLRLHRTALIVWAVVFAGVSAALLWAYGPGASAAADEWRRLCLNGTDVCQWGPGLERYNRVYALAEYAIALLPSLVAAWAGAALIGRELEQGTAQLAWTQGVSPARWLAAKLAVPAALLTAGTAVLVLLHRLVFEAQAAPMNWSWYDDDTFAANGPLAIVWPLAALALGALAGLLLRRSLPALVAALVAIWGTSLAVGLATPRLWPWETRTGTLRTGYPGGTVDVIFGGQGALTSTGARIADPMCRDDAQCLADHDVTGYFTDFHPASHFWPLQLIGTGLALAVAATAAATAFWLLRRRTR